MVSRGGRPDLAGEADLSKVTAPTLLIVGGDDHGVIELNRAAIAVMGCKKALKLVPGATHLFEEPGTLEAGDAAGRRLVRAHVGGRPTGTRRSRSPRPASNAS